MTFELLLAEGKVKPQQITALHLLSAFAIIGSGSVFYFFSDQLKWWGVGLLLLGFALTFVAIFRNKWLLKPERNRVIRIIELMAALCLASFMAINDMWVPAGMFGILAVVIVLAFYWEKGSGEQYVYVSEAGIKLPFSSRKRFIDWQEVESVLYKYGTLTVECDGNKLYQWSIKKTRFERDEFERFCSKQAEKHREKRVAEW